MAAPPKVGGIFSPTDIAQMAQAYEVALRAAGEEGSPLAVIPGRQLRHQLASFIIGAARSGPVEAAFLAKAALDGTQRLTCQRPLSGYLAAG